jgi:predicted dienelactone hydrolase
MDMNGPALTGGIWTPCAAPATEIKLGRATIPGVLNCAVPEGRHPLIVMSHGSAGSFLSHHDTAAALADAGFVVAAINHVGDNAQDRSRQGYLSIFSTRPREIRRVIDYMTTAWPQQARVDAAKIGAFGFSRGAYTVLVLAGAKPDFQAGLAVCQDAPTLPMCRDIASGKIPQQPYVQDARIKAVVIADPLNAFPGNALQAVKIPVQLWASELGGDGVTLAGVEAVRLGLGLGRGQGPGQVEGGGQDQSQDRDKDKDQSRDRDQEQSQDQTQDQSQDKDQGRGHAPNYQVVAGAGHFAFLAPCPPDQAQADICQDAPGFDRRQFHQAWNARMAAFFKAHISDTVIPPTPTPANR